MRWQKVKEQKEERKATGATTDYASMQDISREIDGNLRGGVYVYASRRRSLGSSGFTMMMMTMTDREKTREGKKKKRVAGVDAHI